MRPLGLSFLAMVIGAVVGDRAKGEPAPPIQMPETTLTGEVNSSNDFSLAPLELPGRTETLSSRDIEVRGIQDLGDLTRYSINADVPLDTGSGDGFVPQLSSGNSSINIRGLEGNRILLTLDGIRQPQTFIAGSFDQSANAPGGTGRDFFDPALFESAELIKGAALSRFGSGALGGAVNLESPDPADLLGGESWALEQRGRYFSRNNAWNAVTFSAARVGAVTALAGYSGRMGEETENNGEIAPNPVEFYSHAAVAKVAVAVTETHQLSVAMEYFGKDTQTEVNSAETAPNALGLSNDEVFNHETRERYAWTIEYGWEPGNGALVDGLDTQLYYQTTESSLFNRQRGSQTFGSTKVTTRDREQTNTHDVSILGTNIFTGRHWRAFGLEQTLGAGLNASWSRAENTFERMDQVPEIESNQMGFAPSDTFRVGAILENEIRFGTEQRWTLTPSLRLDYYAVEPDRTAEYEERLQQVQRDIGGTVEPAESYANFSGSPAVMLSYAPTKELLTWSSFTSSVRNPTQEELSLIFLHPSGGFGAGDFVIIPNENLKPERSYAFEAGVAGDYPWASLTLTGFYTYYTDFIEANKTVRDPDPVAGLPGLQQTQNVGDVAIYGLEVGVEVPLDFLAPLSGFAMGVASGGSIGQNLTEDQPLNSVDPWKTVAWLSYDASGGDYGARLTGIFVDEKDADRIDQTQDGGPFTASEAFFVVDLSAYWRPIEALSLAAGINNLFDEEYYKWSTLRRAVGHNAIVTDRLTEPGRNFFLSATLRF